MRQNKVLLEEKKALEKEYACLFQISSKCPITCDSSSPLLSRKRELDPPPGEYVEKSESKKKIKLENFSEPFDKLAEELMEKKKTLMTLKTEKESLDKDQMKKLQEILDNHKLIKDEMLLRHEKEFKNLLLEQEEDRKNCTSSCCKEKQKIRFKIDDCEEQMTAARERIATICSSDSKHSENFPELIYKLAEELMDKKKSLMSLKTEEESIEMDVKKKIEELTQSHKLEKDQMLSSQTKDKKLLIELEKERKDFVSSSCTKKQEKQKRIDECENQLNFVREQMASICKSII